MNMIVGLMVQCIDEASAESRERTTFDALKGKMRTILDKVEQGNDMVSSRAIACIFDHDETLKLLHSIGVDVYALVDDVSSICAHLGGESLRFDDFVSVVWQYRPTNAATIRCVSSLRTVVLAKLCDLEERMDGIDQSVHRTGTGFKSDSKSPR